MKFINLKLLTCFLCLTAASTQASEVTQLNNPTNPGIERFIIDPNNQFVIFNEFNQDTTLDRFSISINGGSNPIEIATDLLNTEDPFWIDQDNSHVLSRNSGANGPFGTLLSVSQDNISTILSPIRSSLPFNEVRNVGTLPGTDLVAFTTFSGDLFSVPIDGNSPAINLSNGLIVDNFRLSEDRQKIAFSAQDPSSLIHGLYISDLNGNSSPTLLAELTTDTDVDGSVRFSSDDSTIVFIAETFLPNSIESLQLFIVATDGSSNAIPIGNSVTASSADIDFNISPDGQHVVFALEDFDLNFEQLFSSPIDGSSDPTLIDEGVELHQFTVTDNNKYIIYSITKQFSDALLSSDRNIPILMRSSLTPENNENSILLSRLSISDFLRQEPLPDAINIDVPFAVTSDSQFVYFIQDFTGDFRTIDQVPNLLRTSIEDPSEMLQINDDSIGLSQLLLPFISLSVEDFILSDDEQTIIYKADAILSLVSPQLVRLTTSNLNNELLPTLETGSVNDFDISNNGEFVVYTTDSGVDDLQNLYSINISEPEPLCFPIKTHNDNFVTICL